MEIEKVLTSIVVVLSSTIAFNFGSMDAFASSGKTALGFVGSSYEKPENKIPKLVNREAQKTIYYKLNANLSSMLCSGFAIEHNGRTYFITAAHCIIERIRDEWSLSGQSKKEVISGNEQQRSSNDQLKALLDFVSKQSWSVLMSQGINIQNCNDHTILIEEKFDHESFKYCVSKSLTVQMRLQYIAGNALTWFVLDKLSPSVFNLVPFYDLAIFEIDGIPATDRLSKMTLADNDVVDGDLEYATGYPREIPYITANESGSPISKPLGKEGLAITWGPKSLNDASAVLQGADGNAVLNALELNSDSWQQSSNVFLSYSRPGMSGGPVLNSKGEVIGLITGTPRYSNDTDYNSMITVGPPLSVIKYAMSKLN